jgi:hypothetical protein
MISSQVSARVEKMWEETNTVFCLALQLMYHFGEHHVALNVQSIEGFVEDEVIIGLKQDAGEGQLLFHSCGIGTGKLIEG